MEQEDRNLLLKDLCSRLPYGVKVRTSVGGEIRNDKKQLNFAQLSLFESGYEDVKPYLSPLSSMTEEQREEYHSFFVQSQRDFITPNNAVKLFDWLLKNHFDYRGLIEKGLAIDCTNLNIY